MSEKRSYCHVYYILYLLQYLCEFAGKYSLLDSILKQYLPIKQDSRWAAGWGSIMNGGRSFIASLECQNISMCNVNPTEGENHEWRSQRGFPYVPWGQRSFLSFINSIQVLPTTNATQSHGLLLKVDVIAAVHANLMWAFRLCPFCFCLFF